MALEGDGMFAKTNIRKNIHQQIVHEIATRIFSGEFRPGDTLSTEDAASAEMNISRTAYREALKVLVAKGLVESRPKTGTRICPRSNWNLLDSDVLAWSFEFGSSHSIAKSLSEMREVIEPACAALAAKRASDSRIDDIGEALERMKSAEPGSRDSIQADLDFHTSILTASGNELLSTLGHLIESALEHSFELSAKKPGAREVSIPRHADVLTAIRHRKPNRAAGAMRRLLKEAWSDLSSVLEHAKENQRQP